MVLAGNPDEIGIATALQQMWGADRHQARRCSNSTTPPAPHATATATFTMRVSAPGPTTFADPNEITSYFVYSPTIDALHSGWKSDEADKLFESVAEGDRRRPSAPSNMRGSRRSINAERPDLSRSTRRPIRWRCSKKVKGFMQIPLGNNIFGARVSREVDDRTGRRHARPCRRHLCSGLDRVWIVLPLLGFILRRSCRPFRLHLHPGGHLRAGAAAAGRSDQRHPRRSRDRRRRRAHQCQARPRPADPGAVPGYFLERVLHRRSRQFDRPEACRCWS